MAVTAAQLNVIIRAEGGKAARGELDAMGKAVNDAGDSFADLWANIAGGAGRALQALDGVSQVIGAISLVGGVTLLAGGARAAWDQVSAVEQATVALRAYEQNASAVDEVLGDLVAYARSDAGVLFNRRDLFAAAQALKMYGAETQNLTKYVEIMSRSVGLGLSNWDDMNRIIGRVGSTGRLTGIEFEYLQQSGYQLDASMRNTTITFEELFAAMDRGMPTDVFEGQAATIEGLIIRIQSAIRGIGNAFLQVDADTNRFIEGGLGDRLTDIMAAIPEAASALHGAAEAIGSAIASIIGHIENLIGAYQRLPNVVQNVLGWLGRLITMFGMLRVAHRSIGLITGLLGVGGLASGVGGLLAGGLFRGGATGAAGFSASLATLVGRINPVGLAITAVVGVTGALIAQWQSAKAETEAWEASLESLNDTLERLRRRGDTGIADRVEGLVGGFGDRLDGMQPDFEPYMKERMKLEIGTEFYSAWEQGLATPPPKWLHQVRQDFEDLEHQYIELVQSLTNSDEMAAFQDKFTDALSDPNVDVNAWLDWVEATLDAATSAEELAAARQLIIDTPLSDFIYQEVEALKELMATAERVREIFEDVPMQVDDLRAQGMGRQADQIERLSDAMQDAFIITAEEQAIAQGFDPSAAWRYGIEDITNISDEAADRLEVSWDRINAALASGDYDNLRLMTDIFEILQNTDLDAEAKVAQIEAISQSLADYVNIAQDVLAILGQGGLTSLLDLTGVESDAIAAANGINTFASSLDTLFRVIVGNTNAIASQFDALFKWADELIAEEGVYSKLDDLVKAGRITGESGVFTGDSEYARAQQAYNQIAEDNLRIQEHVLTIQAKQAPLLAANAAALEDYMGSIADMDAQEQLAALGFMDTSLQEQLGTVIDLTAQMNTLGPQGEQAFRRMAEGIAMTNPALFAMMEEIGLVYDVARNADGTVVDFEINMDGAETVQSAIADLIESIDALTVAIGGIPPLRIETSGLQQAANDVGQVAADIANLNWLVPTTALGAGEGGGISRTPRQAQEPETIPAPEMEAPDYAGTISEAMSQATAAGLVGSTQTSIAIAMGLTTGIGIFNAAASMYEARIVAMAGPMQRAGQTAGLMAGLGVAQGLWAALPQIIAASAAIINTVVTTMNMVGEMASPSRRTREVGLNLGLGPALGINDAIPFVERAADALTEAAVGSMGGNIGLGGSGEVRSNESQGESRGGASITIDFSGATFNNTSREEMNAWAENDLIPGITRAVADRRTGMGAA